MLSGRFQTTDLRDRHPDSRPSRPSTAASWDASLLREISFPDDSYMIPVCVLERQKAACAAF